jgi:hypothetical protein
MKNTIVTETKLLFPANFRRGGVVKKNTGKGDLWVVKLSLSLPLFASRVCPIQRYYQCMRSVHCDIFFCIAHTCVLVAHIFLGEGVCIFLGLLCQILQAGAGSAEEGARAPRAWIDPSRHFQHGSKKAHHKQHGSPVGSSSSSGSRCREQEWQGLAQHLHQEPSIDPVLQRRLQAVLTGAICCSFRKASKQSMPCCAGLDISLSYKKFEALAIKLRTEHSTIPPHAFEV